MKGVGYAINQWATLIRFLTDGRIREISNNGCERAMRATVIGRKNWYFFGSEEGAAAATRLGHQQAVDALLGPRMPAGSLAHGDSPRRARRVVQELGCGQPVVDHHVGSTKPLDATQRDQPGISRARADQRHPWISHGPPPP